ncbi:MAG: thiolase family protein [Lewinellaceae bacterium]|nr:thiolase family protein [Lewinellaceae bacterium]
MKQVYIVSALRTPIGSFGGQFSQIPATQLGSQVVKAAMDAVTISNDDVDEIYFGQVVQANAGQAPARQVAIGAGLSSSTPATTINKVCSSGMKSIIIGAQTIASGDNDVVVCGGMENMSSIPFYVPKARYGYGYGNAELVDGLVRDGLANVYDGVAMGCFADATAKKYDISREEQDRFAIQSYKRSASSWEAGIFKDEVSGVSVTDRKGNVTTIDTDQEYKNVIFEKIPSLRAVFTKDGTVTAANASTINDGAAAVILVSEDALKKYNLKPLAKIISYADAAQDPEWFTTAPVKAAEKALKKSGLTLQDMDLFEVNEAFAVVTLAFIKQLGLDEDKVNVHGGAVSLGHPLGCSGARIVVTLLNALHKKNGKYGLAAICNGGGGASAMIIEAM